MNEQWNSLLIEFNYLDLVLSVCRYMLESYRFDGKSPISKKLLRVITWKTVARKLLKSIWTNRDAIKKVSDSQKISR